MNVTLDKGAVTRQVVTMEYATDKDLEEFVLAKQMLIDARNLRNRVQARIRKRRQRALQAGIKGTEQ